MADTSITQEHRFHEHVHGKPYEGFPLPVPCPFCRLVEFGGIVEMDCGKELDPRFTYHVQCDSCGAEGPAAESPMAAALAWNHSAESEMDKQHSEVVPTLDQLESAIEEQRRKLFEVESTLQILGEALNHRFGGPANWPAGVPMYYFSIENLCNSIEEITTALEMPELTDRVAVMTAQAEEEVAHG